MLLNTEKDEVLEVKQHKEGVTLYIFKDLAVAIDVTGKNYKELSELIFGPYDNETNSGSLNQPVNSAEVVNMDYITECIKKVARSTGMHKFWLYPFGEDSPTGNQERREKARAKLFKKTWQHDIGAAPNGYGYILTI